MTVVTNRPGPSPQEIGRIARRMGGTRNEVNETESTLISSNAPAATGKLGETVQPDAGTGVNTPAGQAALEHAKLLAGSAPSRPLVNATDPNAPVPGKPAVAHKKVATAVAHQPHSETPPMFSQAYDNTTPATDLMK
jgi:hypothetical protein